MLGYWNTTGKQQKLTYSIYQLTLSSPHFESEWVKHIKTILYKIGRQYIWYKQSLITCKTLKHITRMKLYNIQVSVHIILYSSQLLALNPIYLN